MKEALATSRTWLYNITSSSVFTA
uniref:Uncharacterized protein n=1 Tax=Rhizophora mucronata TaxID=61149 RepID=A0A2P2MJU1_RHIMU